MNVRVELKDNIYVVYDNETNEEIDRSPNELSLRLLCQVRGWSLVNPPKRRKHRALLRRAREGGAMKCQYCGGHCTIYDGGEANDYELSVYVCDECGEWQDEEEDEEEL